MALLELARSLLPTSGKDSLETRRSDLPSTVGELVRLTKSKVNQAWQLAVQRSNEYAKALDMGPGDIQGLQDLGGVIAVSLSEGEILLVVKNTCGAPYGDTWRCLLQPRMKDGDMKGVGGGTTYFALLTKNRHRDVLEAIGKGHIRIVNEKVWP